MMDTFSRPIQHMITMLWKLILLAALVTGCAASPGMAPTPTAGIPTPTPLPAGDVRVWVTSIDQTRLLEPQPDLFFGQPGEGTQAIYVNENNRYQQMDGFGAS